MWLPRERMRAVVKAQPLGRPVVPLREVSSWDDWGTHRRT
jgi:hypothetical protein